MNATFFAQQYLSDVDPTAPISVTTWHGKRLTRRDQRSTPAWAVQAELDQMVTEGTAKPVQSVMGARAYIKA